MAELATTVTEQLRQLDSARTLVLGDAHFYSQIVAGVLPIIGPQAKTELQRWGSDFLAESFANPTWSTSEKEKECIGVLPVLRGWLEMTDEDHAVIKSAIQTVASIYGFVFRRMISNPEESGAWENMTAIKSNILRRMDTLPTGIRICCIKFVQKVVQVQTAGIISDPRRPERNETSISLVPRNHPVLSLRNLEAEASGLLDRLLDVFHQDSSDAILINSTSNCVAVLVKSRASVANKIISVILNYNPLKLANTPMTPATKVSLKSMERTTRAVLRNINKSNPNGPLANKIDAYLVRLQQSRNAVFADTTSLKRSAPSEPTDGLDNIKRARFAQGPTYPPMPAPPNSFAQLFTLTEDTALGTFDVKVLPIDLVAPITTAILSHVDQGGLDRAIVEIRSRYDQLQKQAQAQAVKSMTEMAGEEDDDYDPEYEPEPPETEPAVTALPVAEILQPDIALGPYELPKPPPLSEQQVSIAAKQTVDRVLSMISTASTTSHSQKLGFNRLAASNDDRDAWATLMIRLATRAPRGLDDLVSDPDSDENQLVKKEPEVDTPSIANGIRTTLFQYILEDFRSRLNLAISWLNEEWYSERLILAIKKNLSSIESTSSPSSSFPIYSHYSYLFLQTILPYLDARSPLDTRILIRFLSEIPSVSLPILHLVERLAEDPERVTMCIMAFQYLIMMRPPVREACLDAVEKLWRENGEARQGAVKVLTRWRKDVLQAGLNNPSGEDGQGVIKNEEEEPIKAENGELNDKIKSEG